MELIIPIGISGSGKSRLYNLNYQDYVKICPDDIRKELTGSISDQSKNKEVFELAQQRIDDCIANDKNVFYDATNINQEYAFNLTSQLLLLKHKASLNCLSHTNLISQ